MPTLLPGVSHSIIVFNSIEGSKQSGIHAMMKICFGSDDDAISQIMYRNALRTNAPSWMLPTRRSEQGTDYPIFNGRLGQEVLAIVGRAADRLKKTDIIGIKAGRSFRVTKNSVEEITKDIAAAK